MRVVFPQLEVQVDSCLLSTTPPCLWGSWSMMVWDLMWSKSPFWALLPVIDYQYVQVDAPISKMLVDGGYWACRDPIWVVWDLYAIDYGTKTGNLGPKRFLLGPLACSGPVAWAKWKSHHSYKSYSWLLGGATCIGCKFGHQVAQLMLVAN